MRSSLKDADGINEQTGRPSFHLPGRSFILLSKLTNPSLSRILSHSKQSIKRNPSRLPIPTRRDEDREREGEREMASKLWSAVALLLFALAASSLGAANAQSFVVEGRVYCDTCRAGFETTATEYLTGARVRLECSHQESGELVHTVEGVTDETGTYHLKVADDHEDEICEVVLVKSPEPECSEIKAGRDRGRILLTHNSGLASNVRVANSLGFLRTEPLPACGALLAQYQLGDDED